MNKKVVVGAAVLLVPVYVAASWGLGRAAHARFDQFESLANVSGTPIFKVAERTYTPGIFSSEERFTFELNREIFGGVLDAHDHDANEFDSDEEDDFDLEDASDELVAPSAELPRFTVLHKVQHGPLPGFRSLGLARIESTLELSDEARAAIAEVLGDEDPLRVTTLIGFSGSGSSTVTSPAFEYQDEGEKLSWQGFEGTFDYDRNIGWLECDARAPGMKVTSASGGLIAELGEITFDCDLERAFDSLYSGTAAVKIASLRHTSAEESMRIEQISYVTKVRKDGDYLDMALDFGAGNIEVEGFAMNDLRYDLSINHMHGPTYAAMQRAMEEAVASSMTNPADAANVLAAFGEYLPRLLEHSPQLVINRIGFSMPEGEAGLKGTVQFKDLTQDDLSMGAGMALLGKLEASVDFWLSEGLLTRDWTGAAMNTEASDGPSTAEKLAMMQMQIAQLEQQGYIGRNGDRLESHIEFKSGALTANGQPIGPMGGVQ